jgi:type II secretory pathway component PulK
MKGSLLVVTLWLVAILGVLSVAIARYLSLEVRMTRYRLAREQARTWARSGIYLAMQRLKEDAQQVDEPDWLKDDWASFAPGEADPEDPTQWVIPLTEGRVSIRIADEERRLNLNQLGEADCFTALGTLLGSPEHAARIADYLGLGSDEAIQPPNQEKNAPVSVPEELLDIPDIGEAFEALRQHTSVAEASSPWLNINTVQPDVLRALGFSESSVSALEACREQDTEQAPVFHESTRIAETAEGQCGVSPDERSRLMGRFGIASRTFRVVSTGAVDHPAVRARVEAVIQRSSGGPQTARLLAWKED